MNKLTLLVLLAGSSLFFNACRKVIGEGPVVTENRVTNSFTALASRISANVVYRQDSVYRVEISAQQNIINIIETQVSNNELVLRFKDNVIVRRHEDILISIRAPSLTGLSISGSGDLEALGTCTPANLRMEISGSGNVIIQKLVTNDIEAIISGSGKMQVNSGSANNETLKISGSGSIDLVNVVAKSAKTTTSGSGHTRVNLSESLDAKISGSGHVYYKGNPVVTVSVSGSGKIIPL